VSHTQTREIIMVKGYVLDVLISMILQKKNKDTLITLFYLKIKKHVIQKLMVVDPKSMENAN
jgi:hypothetical protein